MKLTDFIPDNNLIPRQLYSHVNFGDSNLDDFGHRLNN